MSKGLAIGIAAALAAALLAGLVVARGATHRIMPGPAIGASQQGTGSAVLLENEAVRVVENRYPPGAESPEHTHASPRVVYVLEGGSIRLIGEDGSEADMVVEPGMTLWRPAETHVVRNIGATPVRLLETEVRGAGP